jgi:hypothetical protein
MALTSDQTAVLEMLLAGRSYEDLASLLDLGEDDVRARARAALTELGGADPDRSVGLTDYLLGHADPIGRADAVRHLRQDAADHELAEAISARLAEMAPAADLPKLPPPPGGGRFLSREPSGSAADGAEPARRSPLAAIPGERGRLYAALGAAAVVLIGVVLAITGVFSGDDESPAADTPAEASAGDETDGIGAVPPGEELERVPLAPVGNGDAAGAAIVGILRGDESGGPDVDQAYVDVIVRNLSPAPQGQAYVVWFMFDNETGYPLSPIFPDQDGSFSDRFSIPTAVTALVAQTKAIEVSVSDANETLRMIQKAARDQTFRIQRPGTTVLRGEISQAQNGNGQAG